MADPIRRIEISKNFLFLWKFVYRDFRNPWSDFKNHNSCSNMAVKKWENHLILIIIRIHWVFGSLISNKLSDFRNSKWLIQYGRSKFRKIFHFYENLYIGIFQDSEYESAVRFFKNQNSGSNMAVKNFENCSIFMRIRIYRVFGSLISNKLSDFRNSKWLIQYGRSKFRKNFHFYENLYIGIFEDADYESAVRF